LWAQANTRQHSASSKGGKSRIVAKLAEVWREFRPIRFFYPSSRNFQGGTISYTTFPYFSGIRKNTAIFTELTQKILTLFLAGYPLFKIRLICQIINYFEMLLGRV